MKEKFTPGPWEKQYARRRDEWGIYPKGEIVIIASVMPNVPEYDANAALIAAAPELYEALMPFAALARVFESRGYAGNVRVMSFDNREVQINASDCYNARAALAKAQFE